MKRKEIRFNIIATKKLSLQKEQNERNDII